MPLGSKALPELMLTMTSGPQSLTPGIEHDDVMKWKHFPCYWPFERGIRRWPVNSPHKGRWRGALIFSFICAWINGWVNNREALWFETPSRSLWRHHNEWCTSKESNVTWALVRLKSRGSRLFYEKLVRDNNKEIIKVSITNLWWESNGDRLDSIQFETIFE